MKHLPLYLSLLLALPALAADWPAPLPPADIVERVLLAQPEVLAAGKYLDAETANRRRLEAGEHEWGVRAGAQRRRSMPENMPTARFSEWNIALERPLRLPDKRQTDSALGESGVNLAASARGDALHEAGRQLLQRWFAKLKTEAAEQQWAAQVGLLKQEAAAITRRQQLGDAARIDRVLADAAVAQAEAQWLIAHQRSADAMDTLRRHYPELPNATPSLPDTLPAFTGSEEEWVAAMLEHNHELQLARGESAHSRLQATRQRQNRLPDPSVGVQWSRERGGEENVLGAYISLPLPGESRRAAADVAQAQAAAAQDRQTAVERRVAAEAAASYRAAINGRSAWDASRRAAEQTAEAGTMSARAYQLGEGSLGDVLQARRQANEARLAGHQAQLDALEAHYRLLLDTHRLWDLD